MTEAAEVIREEPEGTPAQLPSDLNTVPAGPAPSDDLDRLLQEYTDATNKPEPDLLPGGNNPETAAPDQNLDQQIADLLGPDPKVAELQGQLNDMRVQLHRESEIKAYHDYADDLQKHIQESNPNVPDGFAKLLMDSWAHNPEVALAWDVRNIDPKAAAVDLAHVQHALRQLQENPNANSKQVQQLNTLAYQLNAAVNSASVLRQVRNQIISEVKKLKPPIDELATADHDAVAFAVREAHSGDIPEPKPNFGIMSDREFRDYTKKHFGF